MYHFESIFIFVAVSFLHFECYLNSQAFTLIHKNEKKKKILFSPAVDKRLLFDFIFIKIVAVTKKRSSSRNSHPPATFFTKKRGSRDRDACSRRGREKCACNSVGEIKKLYRKVGVNEFLRNDWLRG